MKILVTGGLGFIGSHTVFSLIDKGYEPIIIDNLSNTEIDTLRKLESLCEKKITFYHGDIRNTEFLESVFSENQIEAILHFAALKSVNESIQIPIAYYENNISGLISLMKVAKRNGVIKLIFSSSCTVYGQSEEIPVTEQTPLKNAETPYGHTKFLGEEILMSLSKVSSVQIILLRYFNPIGAHPSGKIGELPKGVPQNLVPFVTQTAIGLRDKLRIFGNDYNTYDGTAVRDYIHVMDLADAHVACIDYFEQNKDFQYEVFNVGTGKGVSVLELVKTFEKVNEIDLNFEFAERRLGDIAEIFADTTKVNRVLGWKAKRGLEDALKDAWSWELKLKNKNNIENN
ncbi:MAG: UDP-glucose 4-epimerase GalE [Bacteroidia bacterium]